MGWRMNVSGRYEHRKAHLEELAALHGLEVVSYEQVVARRRHADVDAEPVRAHLFVLTPSSVE
jgi:predicted TPR repeat methyltransferase